MEMRAGEKEGERRGEGYKLIDDIGVFKTWPDIGVVNIVW